MKNYVCLTEDPTVFRFHVIEADTIEYAEEAIRSKLRQGEHVVFLNEPNKLSDEEMDQLIDSINPDALLDMVKNMLFAKVMRERIRRSSRMN